MQLTDFLIWSLEPDYSSFLASSAVHQSVSYLDGGGHPWCSCPDSQLPCSQCHHHIIYLHRHQPWNQWCQPDLVFICRATRLEGLAAEYCSVCGNSDTIVLRQWLAGFIAQSCLEIASLAVFSRVHIGGFHVSSWRSLQAGLVCILDCVVFTHTHKWPRDSKDLEWFSVRFVNN